MSERDSREDSKKRRPEETTESLAGSAKRTKLQTASDVEQEIRGYYSLVSDIVTTVESKLRDEAPYDKIFDGAEVLRELEGQITSKYDIRYGDSEYALIQIMHDTLAKVKRAYPEYSAHVEQQETGVKFTNVMAEDSAEDEEDEGGDDENEGGEYDDLLDEDDLAPSVDAATASSIQAHQTVEMQQSYAKRFELQSKLNCNLLAETLDRNFPLSAANIWLFKALAYYPMAADEEQLDILHQMNNLVTLVNPYYIKQGQKVEIKELFIVVDVEDQMTDLRAFDHSFESAATMPPSRDTFLEVTEADAKEKPGVLVYKMIKDFEMKSLAQSYSSTSLKICNLESHPRDRSFTEGELLVFDSLALSESITALVPGNTDGLSVGSPALFRLKEWQFKCLLSGRPFVVLSESQRHHWIIPMGIRDVVSYARTEIVESYTKRAFSFVAASMNLFANLSKMSSKIPDSVNKLLDVMLNYPTIRQRWGDVAEILQKNKNLIGRRVKHPSATARSIYGAFHSEWVYIVLRCLHGDVNLNDLDDKQRVDIANGEEQFALRLNANGSAAAHIATVGDFSPVPEGSVRMTPFLLRALNKVNSDAPKPAPPPPTKEVNATTSASAAAAAPTPTSDTEEGEEEGGSPKDIKDYTLYTRKSVEPPSAKKILDKRIAKLTKESRANALRRQALKGEKFVPTANYQTPFEKEVYYTRLAQEISDEIESLKNGSKHYAIIEFGERLAPVLEIITSDPGDYTYDFNARSKLYDTLRDEYSEIISKFVNGRITKKAALRWIKRKRLEVSKLIGKSLTGNLEEVVIEGIDSDDAGDDGEGGFGDDDDLDTVDRTAMTDLFGAPENLLSETPTSASWILGVEDIRIFLQQVNMPSISIESYTQNNKDIEAITNLRTAAIKVDTIGPGDVYKPVRYKAIVIPTNLFITKVANAFETHQKAKDKQTDDLNDRLLKSNIKKLIQQQDSVIRYSNFLNALLKAFEERKALLLTPLPPANLNGMLASAVPWATEGNLKLEKIITSLEELRDQIAASPALPRAQLRYIELVEKQRKTPKEITKEEGELLRLFEHVTEARFPSKEVRSYISDANKLSERLEEVLTVTIPKENDEAVTQEATLEAIAEALSEELATEKRASSVAITAKNFDLTNELGIFDGIADKLKESERTSIEMNKSCIATYVSFAVEVYERCLDYIAVVDEHMKTPLTADPLILAQLKVTNVSRGYTRLLKLKQDILQSNKDLIAAIISTKLFGANPAVVQEQLKRYRTPEQIKGSELFAFIKDITKSIALATQTIADAALISKSLGLVLELIDRAHLWNLTARNNIRKESLRARASALIKGMTDSLSVLVPSNVPAPEDPMDISAGRWPFTKKNKKTNEGGGAKDKNSKKKKKKKDKVSGDDETKKGKSTLAKLKRFVTGNQ